MPVNLGQLGNLLARLDDIVGHARVEWWLFLLGNRYRMTRSSPLARSRRPSGATCRRSERGCWSGRRAPWLVEGRRGRLMMSFSRTSSQGITVDGIMHWCEGTSLFGDPSSLCGCTQCVTVAQPGQPSDWTQRSAGVIDSHLLCMMVYVWSNIQRTGMQGFLTKTSLFE